MTMFDELGARIAREQDALLARRNAQAEVKKRLADHDHEFLRAAHARHAVRRIRARAAAALTLSAVAAAAAFLWLAPAVPQRATLAVQLVDDKRELHVGEYVQAPTERTAALHFSDGSHIDLARGSRARVLNLRASGADVSLESGQLHMQVKHREDSSWHVGAGPFVVHVTGTRFDLGWKPDSDSFELTLHEGRVDLSGCSFGAGYHVLAGQTVRASCKNAHFDVSATAALSAAPTQTAGAVELSPQAADHAQERTSSAPEAMASDAMPPAPTRKESAPAASGADSRSSGSWQVFARKGQYAQALRVARALGFERECQRASAQELSLLANVARYGQDSEREAEALHWLRARFRGSKRAALAAFALGRLEFDHHAAYAEAAEWFRVYLKEQPRGDLAREASGRLLEATQRVGDHAAAQELAQRYVRDYPHGPHAELARRISPASSER